MFIKLPKYQQVEFLDNASRLTKLSAQAIEKDWWVTMVLRVLFQSKYSNNLAFKGGTSLSKGWDLIHRFSEDIDIVIDREFLGFSGELTHTQINDKLRRAACTFVRELLSKEVEQQLLSLGINADLFSVTVNKTSVSTVDPEIVEIKYKSVLSQAGYIENKLLLEVGARSMMEPTENRLISSILSKTLLAASTKELPVEVRTVMPQRTFLEKAFLLHEEFSKPVHEIRVDRMSRHLYDLERLMDTSYAENALRDTELYYTIIDFRKKYIGLKNMNYRSLYPDTISFVPPDSVSKSY